MGILRKTLARSVRDLFVPEREPQPIVHLDCCSPTPHTSGGHRSGCGRLIAGMAGSGL